MGFSYFGYQTIFTIFSTIFSNLNIEYEDRTAPQVKPFVDYLLLQKSTEAVTKHFIKKVFCIFAVLLFFIFACKKYIIVH